MVGIYIIKNPFNKLYVGYSFDIDKRFNQYLNYNCRNQKSLYNSLRKYGAKLHTYSSIHIFKEDATLETLNKYERIYYDIFVNLGFEMLNLKVPGEIGNGKHGQETKDKISIKNRKHNYPITQFTKNGIFIKIWKNMYEVSTQLDIPTNCIVNNLQNTVKTTNNYIFRKGKINSNIIPPERKKRIPIIMPKGIRRKRPIYQYDHGILVKEWFSATIAAEELGLTVNGICANVAGRIKQHGGFQWIKKTTL